MERKMRGEGGGGGGRGVSRRRGVWKVNEGGIGGVVGGVSIGRGRGERGVGG